MTVNPTIVIGVGEAGCKMTRDLYDDLAEMHEDPSAFLDQFLFVGIDTRAEDLENHTRDNFTTISLDTPTQVWGEDSVNQYSYLTGELELNPAGGATRQRSVSRFYIDNQVNFNDLYRGLEDNIGTFLNRDRPSTSAPESSPNLWIVNSFGGGTGSGAFPLLTAMIHDILPEDVWVGGIGSLPRIDRLEDTNRPPEDDASLYANSYAALRELSVLLDYEFAESDDGTFDYQDAARLPDGESSHFPLTIDVPSEPSMNPKGEYTLEEPPFDFYGLLCLNEGQSGKGDYLENINRVAVNTILYFSEATGLEDFGSSLTGDGNDALFSLDSGGVEIPVSTLQRYTDEIRKLGQVQNELAGVRKELNAERINRDVLRYITDLSPGNSPSVDPKTALSTVLTHPETGEEVHIEDIVSAAGDEEDDEEADQDADFEEEFFEGENEDEPGDSDELRPDVGIDLGGAWGGLTSVYETAYDEASRVSPGDIGALDDIIEKDLYPKVGSFSSDFEFDAEDVALYFFLVEMASRFREERANHPFRDDVDEQIHTRSSKIRKFTSENPGDYEDSDPDEQWELVETFYDNVVDHLKEKLEGVPFYKPGQKKEVESLIEEEQRNRRRLKKRYNSFSALDEALEVLIPQMRAARTELINQRREFETELDESLLPELERLEERETQYVNTLEKKQEVLREEGNGPFRTIPFDKVERLTGGTLDDAEDIIDLVDREVVSASELVQVMERVLSDEMEEPVQDLEPHPIKEGIASEYLAGMAGERNRQVLRGELDSLVSEASVGDAMTFDETDFVGLADPFSIRVAAFYSNIRLENTSEFGTFHRLYRSPNQFISEEFGEDIDDDDFVTSRIAYPEFFPEDEEIQAYFGEGRAAVALEPED